MHSHYLTVCCFVLAPLMYPQQVHIILVFALVEMLWCTTGEFVTIDGSDDIPHHKQCVAKIQPLPIPAVPVRM